MNSKPQKSSSKPFKTFLYAIILTTIIISIIIIFLILLIIITTTTSSPKLIHFSKPNNNNNNNIIVVPKGKVLRNLREYSFIHNNNYNSSLYRFGNDRVLVLDEDEKNHAFPCFLSYENNYNFENDEVKVIMMMNDDDNYNNIMEKYECEGVCKCYVVHNNNGLDDDNRRTSITNLVYSYRYTSLIVVSLFGFATAKFIDENIDDCYKNANENLNLLSDSGEDNDRGEGLSCSMEEKFCELYRDLDEYEKRTFRCTGHCLTSSRLKNRYAIESAQEMSCEKQNGPQEMFEVKFTDVQVFVKYKEGVKHPSWMRTAKMVYRKNFLTPFCKGIITTYSDLYGKRKIKPCVARNYKFSNIQNVECKLVGTVW